MECEINEANEEEEKYDDVSDDDNNNNNDRMTRLVSELLLNQK